MMGSKGQVTIEYLLVGVLLIGAAVFFFNIANQSSLLASLTSRPWAAISGMIEFGSWSTRSASQLRRANATELLHPSSRLLSLKPNESECK